MNEAIQSPQDTDALPEFVCHKEVRAAIIVAVRTDSVTVIVNDRCVVLENRAAYVTKHAPEPGGWFVRYRDGYESFSPAKAFEEGYVRKPVVNKRAPATKRG